MNITLYQNLPEDTQNWTNLYLEPYDYRIYYVNIDLRHQYGISAAESQRFLRAKRPQRRRPRRNGCFRRLFLAMTLTKPSLLEGIVIPFLFESYKSTHSITTYKYLF